MYINTHFMILLTLAFMICKFDAAMHGRLAAQYLESLKNNVDNMRYRDGSKPDYEDRYRDDSRADAYLYSDEISREPWNGENTRSRDRSRSREYGRNRDKSSKIYSDSISRERSKSTEDDVSLGDLENRVNIDVRNRAEDETRKADKGDTYNVLQVKKFMFQAEPVRPKIESNAKSITLYYFK